ncbi:trypsin-like peptidase domain-containing protein [Virgibacillus sp. 179-BFC.A HS]|uniref:Trypsin-like peptidase domain-containing protein n=1 Tax=Tigheibacillus jepli TaxID=3035914 RepID=A0ABU5CCU4_9BACI|nr:trypsin-like peptidase domain-containing protein [Virgibacillus sp. 179-BFC.A HS]MDY0404148.1 trypsin-like peptidase domain-containing protein [Virgibacillus sp. 179-BFC.A HS]
MGYYDEQYPKEPKKRKRKSWLVPVLLGIIIGILLVVVALPAVENSRLFNGNDTATESENPINRDNGERVTNVKVNISSQITDVVSQVSPAVVGVTNFQNQANFWEPNNKPSEAATGSGVIYKQTGQYAYVVTNYHVIEGADKIGVVLNDDTDLDAKLLGGDLFSDLAVLRVSSKPIKKVIELGKSANVKVGEPVIAIGNPLGLQFAGSVTQGIISGKLRTVPQDFNKDGRPDWQAEVIQTDAAINPGNSGGALINMEGQLIGINSMKINEAAVEGIGFSIPIDTAKPVMDQLEKKGKVIRPYLGLELYSLDDVPRDELHNTLKLPRDVEKGVYVWSVESFSPADNAGIKRLDVITALDDKPITDMIELRRILFQEKKVGDKVKVTFYRNGKKKETTVTLGEQK